MTINAKMEVGSSTEVITVTGQASAIDLEAATVGVNWDIHKLDDVPYSRSLVALNSMLPGVYFSGKLDVGGSQFGTGSAVGGNTFGRSGNNVMAIDGLVWCQEMPIMGRLKKSISPQPQKARTRPMPV